MRELRYALDRITRALNVIDYAHHEIHAGSHFLYTDAISLNAAGSQDYLITVPDTAKWPHMIFILEGSAITQFDLYEGTDKNGTTLQTVGNSNRNSDNVAGVTVHKGVSGGSIDGTLIHTYKGGAATNQARASGSTRNDEEIILRQNTKYILRVTSGTNSNLINVNLSWYEHTSKLELQG